MWVRFQILDSYCVIFLNLLQCSLKKVRFNGLRCVYVVRVFYGYKLLYFRNIFQYARNVKRQELIAVNCVF